VRCWGENGFGTLGQGNTTVIGDNELPSSVPIVSLTNTPIIDLISGDRVNCVIYDVGTIRCWGLGTWGALGYGNTNHIGDNELPSSRPVVSVGGTVDELRGGSNHTCVRVDTDVKCWGYGAEGAIGQANTNTIGDNEVPSSIGFIVTGLAVTSLAEGPRGGHVCAQAGAELRCWGPGDWGRLGYGNNNIIGDNETPASAGSVSY
jgi:hypothetical protein